MSSIDLRVSRGTPLTTSQLMSLITTVEKQGGEDFIHLVYSLPKAHPKFHPYHFKIGDNQSTAKRNTSHYTLSKSGILHMSHGSVEFISIPQFRKELGLYETIMKIPFFAKYRIWKGFKIWRAKVTRRKRTFLRNLLMDTMLINTRPLRVVLGELSKLCEGLSKINLLNVDGRITYDLDKFLEQQTQHGRKVFEKLKLFEHSILEMTTEVCRVTLIEYGFSPDTYQEELEYLEEFSHQNMPVTKLDYPGEWLLYSEQATKRHVCKRLASFLRLVDYRIQHAYFKILKTAMNSLLLELSGRMDNLRDKNYGAAATYTETLHQLLQEHEKLVGNIALLTSAEPVFLVKCSWTSNQVLEFSPSATDISYGLQSLFNEWATTILGYENISTREMFYPYTRPIINGHLDPTAYVDGPNMELLINNDLTFSNIVSVMQLITIHGIEICSNYLKTFDNIRKLCLENEKGDAKLHDMETNPGVLSNLFAKFTEQATLLEKVEDTKDLGIFRIDNSTLKEFGGPAIKNCLEALRKRIPAVTAIKITSTRERIKSSIDILKKSPVTSEEYVEYSSQLKRIPEEMPLIEMDLNKCTEFLGVMNNHSIQPPEDIQLEYNELKLLIFTLRVQLNKQLDQKEKLMEELVQMFHFESDELQGRLSEIRVIAEGEDILSPTSDSGCIAEKLKTVMDELVKMQEKAKWLESNGREYKVEMLSKFDSLDKLTEFVKIMYQLLDAIQNFTVNLVVGLEESQIKNVNPKELTKEVDKYLNAIEKLEQELPPNDLLPVFKAKVEFLQMQLPWLECLHNPNLVERHWEELNSIVGVNLPEKTMTFKQLLDLGVTEYIQFFQKINFQADAEANLEATLKRIKDSWATVKFKVLPYRDHRDIRVLGDTENIQTFFDDCQIQLSTIFSSKHVTPIKHKVDEMIHLLESFDETLEEWRHCQTRWIQLEPIFSKPDMKLKLPNESKLFAQVNKGWKEIMSKTARSPSAFHAATSIGTLEALQQNNQLIDQIMRSLDDYLESKRIKFPRFYFISNEELLEILSQGRDPHAVQPYLHKFFGAIEKLELAKKASPTGVDILGMCSPEGERVSLRPGLKAKESAEVWLKKLEEGIISTLKRKMASAMKDYKKLKMDGCLQKYPAQIVLVVCQVTWAQSVHKILISPASTITKKLRLLEEKYAEKLEDLRAKLRGQLTPLMRVKLTSMSIITFHSKQVIENMLHSGVDSPSSFQWLQHLRYSWNPTKQLLSAQLATGNYNYGYEYLGASPKLVITPLTERSFLSLLLALQLNLGGAVVGPSGVGKTETIKDFANYLANYLVLINCSQRFDSKMMTRTFSGIVQSGGWVCLDHFDKLEVGVMSFIAHQLQIIRLAKISKLTRFIFEGKEIRLAETCSVFITMNSEGDTRGKVPENLATLFRPVNMIVPDTGVVAEMILFSLGFEQFKMLAKKLSQIYTFCGNLLPHQNQYDFGMRALLKVLEISGELKRVSPTVEENILVVKAVIKSNLARMPHYDVVMLMDIIKDFFPTAEMSGEDHDGNDRLNQAVEQVALDKGLQIPYNFIQKVIQLHDALACHKNVMLVGSSGTGKTTAYEILKGAMSVCPSHPKADMKPVEVVITVLNPKGLSMADLYGELNPITHEWKDGLFGSALRKAIQSNGNSHYWIVFDGPVDPAWTESLNTVLDDNNMLCLPTMERIKLPLWAHIIFEVDDLAYASPATVFRCGIVHMNPNDLGWSPIFQSWLSKCVMDHDEKEHLENLMNKYYNDGLQFAKGNCKEVIPQTMSGKITTFCSLMESILLKKSSVGSLQQVCQFFLFSYVWSIGGNVQEGDSSKFNQFVYQQLENEEDFAFLDKEANAFEIYPNFQNDSMESWDTIVHDHVNNFETSFQDIFVPTLDTVRYGYLMELLLSVNKAVLITGERGIGKSYMARHVLNSISGPESIYLPLHVLFSYGTCIKTTQKLIENTMNKNQKSLLSAPRGKRLIVMIDDLNMPKRDEYESQPVLEFIRQLIDKKGCHDNEKLFWKRVENIVLAGACCPSGGSQGLISPRLIRHFTILAIPSPSNASLTKIYSTILHGFLSEFITDSGDLIKSLVSVIISTYNYTKDTFLPTPSKFHYLFSMQDLSRSIQGILKVSKDNIPTNASVARLLCHELQRVFHDRLVTEEERHDFNKNLARLSGQVLKEEVTPDELCTLSFGDFMEMEGLNENRIYEEISDTSKLTSVLTNYLEDFNAENRWRQMNLVLFPEFVRQVTRLVRLFKMENSHTLLLGVGGIGKQSLARLAAYICRMKWCNIEKVKECDLKKIYETAGLKKQPLALYIPESQLTNGGILETINSILVSGEAPDLLGRNEIEMKMREIKEGVREDELYNCFLRRVKANLHLALSVSPTGNGFRKMSRMYPSLISCCSINVISEWGGEALLFVANFGLSKINLGGSNVSVDTLSQMSVLVHGSSEKMAEKFFSETKRRCYVTPSSYLEMIHLYSSLLKDEREKIVSGKARIQNGLLKVLETEELVKQMRVELKDLEPLLIQKSQAVEDLMLVLSEDLAGADIVRRNVHVEESTAKEKAGETQAIAEDAQKDLAEALPALEAAVKSLDSLEKADVVELKQFQKPPELVRTVMEAVCILFELKPDWATAKVLVTDGQFLKKLYDFDKDNVSESTIKKLKVYIDNPNFTPKKIEKVSKACKSICMWVRAIDLYAKVFKTVEPKRSRYLTSQTDLDKVMDTLKSKQEQLNDVERRISSLQQRYEGSMKEKQDLVDNMELTASRLRRAARLTMALASEQTKWAEDVEKFGERMKNLVGDVFVATACIAYFGAFSPEYRRQLVMEWVQKCAESNIPVTPGFSLVTFADPFEVRIWNSFELPMDPTSTENGVLVTRTRRWPLMIDPHGYANKWIKEQESSRNLKVLTFSDLKFMAMLQKCIRLGTPCLIEDVKEDVSEFRRLEAVILRQVCLSKGKSLIRIGGKELTYDHNFRLYLTTLIENPNYNTAIWSSMTVINFMVTQSCLEDEFLSIVVGLERPDLESQRQNLVTQLSSDKNELISQENTVLGLLFNSEGNILDDEVLIDGLNDFKGASNLMARRVSDIEAMEGGIHKAREKYRPVAALACVLYFSISKISELNPMYQFSLNYFRQLFINCVSATEPTEELTERLSFLQSEVTDAVYKNVSRGLYEKDKFTFSFLICSQILRSKKTIREAEWTFFLQGGVKCEKEKNSEDFPGNAPEWLNKDVWRVLTVLEGISEDFKGLKEAAMEYMVTLNIGSRLDFTLFDNPKATISQSDKWNKKLTSFQKLLFLTSIYPERLKEVAMEFVCHELGQIFVESPLPRLVEIQKELNNFTPLIFILSRGSNPTEEFYRFANEHSNGVCSISLGMGPEQVVERMLRRAFTTGDWVFLQNCHLAPSWLLNLEKIVNTLQKTKESTNDNFRLFLSSTSITNFPTSILHNSIKVTTEPAKGIRGNIRQVLSHLDIEYFEHNIQGQNWRKMVFGLSLFHAVIRERKQFGWGVNYDFTDCDRNCCLQILETFCKNDNQIPWDALEVTIGQIVYG